MEFRLMPFEFKGKGLEAGLFFLGKMHRAVARPELRPDQRGAARQDIEKKGVTEKSEGLQVRGRGACFRRKKGVERLCHL